MNQVVFNISLIILSLGFILLIIYITILSTKKQHKPCKPCAANISCGINNSNSNSLEQIYDDRPSITYIKMFKDSNIGFGQDNFDANDDVETSSFYFKSQK